MATYNFNGGISGPANFGDNGRIEITYGQSPAEASRLAAELVARLRADDSDRAGHAEEVQGELAAAGREGRPVDRGRIRRALETLSTGLAAGSAALALVQGLGHALGL
jgi:hypothetical protein